MYKYVLFTRYRPFWPVATNNYEMTNHEPPQQPLSIAEQPIVMLLKEQSNQKNANKRGNHQKAQVRFKMVAISCRPKSVSFPD
jgi:hypothetical protein